MKYSTKEVCYFGINARCKARREKAKKQSEFNANKYEANLSRVLPKLPKKFRAFFKENGQLGDSHVHEIVFGSTHYDRRDERKNKNYIEIHVRHIQNGKLYILRYFNIRRCVFDHPSKQIIYFDKENPLLMDWYTDELRMTKDEWFIHEIIFSSGATLLIEFEKFSYKTRK